MYREKKFRCPVYDMQMCIIVTDNYKEINKRHDLEFEDIIFCHTVKGGIKISSEKELRSCIYLIFNPKYKFEDRYLTHGVIAHECFHATNFLFMIIGAKPDINNDEPQAYLINYLVDQVEDFIKPFWKQ